MARKIAPLTDTQLKNAKPKEKLYTLFDGGGLYMEVTPKGSKRWRFKYTFNGKTYKKSLGMYPDTTLSNARKQRDTARVAIAEGRDPFPKKQAATELKTFRWFTEWYFNGDPSKKKDIPVSAAVSEGHIKQTREGWNRKVLPYIGDKGMSAVTASDIVEIIKDIRDTPALATKIFASINRLYGLSIVHYSTEVTSNPCAGIRISDILVGAKKKKNYPIITEKKELKKLLLKIDEYDKPKPRPKNTTRPKRGSTSVKRLLILLSYTFVRPANAREALWSEFDLDDAKQWVIPAEKMKSKREHIVPLADQVVTMLKEWKEEAASDVVFPGQSAGFIGTAAPAQALHRIGFDIVAHSFRGIFSTIANEENETNEESYSYAAIETQLAHVVGDRTARSYNRALYIKERTKMMQWYADYLDGIKNAED